VKAHFESPNAPAVSVKYQGALREAICRLEQSGMLRPSLTLAFAKLSLDSLYLTERLNLKRSSGGFNHAFR
jgi:hypothetical protein